jgi:hypothetical protein
VGVFLRFKIDWRNFSRHSKTELGIVDVKYERRPDMSEQYILHIEGLTPGTLPMHRLSAYLKDLADMFGSKSEVHFQSIESGSVKLAVAIDDMAVVKVSDRVNSLKREGAPKDVLAAFKRLDNLLAEDNATAKLETLGGAEIIPFPGASRPEPLNYGPFKRQGMLEGEIVRIGGADKTSHVVLQHSGQTYTGIELTRELARDMASLLYGPTVRFYGEGTWSRNEEGHWKLENFKVSSFEILDATDLKEILRDLREFPDNGLMAKDAYSNLLKSRSDGDAH